MSEEEQKNGIQAALEAGEQLSCLQKINRDEHNEKSFILVREGFRIEEINNYLEKPVRKTGTKNFVSAKSFCHYVNKHKFSDETVIIANEDIGEVLAIINDHGKTSAAWGDFCARLKLGFSDQWKVWFDNAHPQRGNFFEQGDFADFIEDNRSDLKVGVFRNADGNEVENLSALALSALVNNLQMTLEQRFKSKRDPESGMVSMMYEDEKTGKGNVEIPSRIFLAIPVYKNGDLFQVEIRLRHRIQSGSARFYYIIDQVPLLKEAAFDKICRRIEKGNSGSEEDENKQFEGVGLGVLKGTF